MHKTTHKLYIISIARRFGWKSTHSLISPRLVGAQLIHYLRIYQRISRLMRRSNKSELLKNLFTLWNLFHGIYSVEWFHLNRLTCTKRWEFRGFEALLEDSEIFEAPLERISRSSRFLWAGERIPRPSKIYWGGWKNLQTLIGLSAEERVKN